MNTQKFINRDELKAMVERTTNKKVAFMGYNWDKMEIKFHDEEYHTIATYAVSDGILFVNL